MWWRNLQFEHYRRRYGAFEAQGLLLLGGVERRNRLEFLERQLSSATDIEQPLWPELSHAHRRMLQVREDAVRAITRKNRLSYQIDRLRKERADMGRPDVLAKLTELESAHANAISRADELKRACLEAVGQLKELQATSTSLARSHGQSEDPMRL